ncbi:probable RNA-directed DNA polymerase from transposon X-element [Trichonephila clavipes]|nr:probable RNA-directed DNA polymerase from transposon X-element [Trichonephila clavipes]
MIGLSLISWNANGILNKILEFKLFVEKYSPDVILIQETHLRPVHKFSVANYKCYRNDRITDGPASGGTLILIKKSIPHFNTPTPQLYYIESTTVTINPPNFDPLTITSIYVPHHSDKYLFTLDIDTIMQVNSHCVIFGDFNATHNTWNCSQNSTRGTHLKNYCDSTDFEIIFPATSTRFGYGTQNTLDFAIVKNFNFPYSIESLPELSSDHNPVFLNFSFSFPIHQVNPRAVTTCWHLFKKCLNNNILIENYANIKNPHILENKIEDFTEAVRSAHTEASKPITNTHHSYTPNHIKNLIFLKNRARKLYQNTLNPIFKTETNRLQAKIKRELKKHSQETWKNKLIALNTQDNSFWNIQKIFKHKRVDIPALKTNSGIAITDDQKANLIADTLKDNFTQNTRPNNYNSTIDSDVTSTLENFFSSPPSIPISPTNPLEVSDYIKKLKIRKTPGKDNITNKMIRNFSLKALIILTYLINKILILRHFPQNWKIAVIFPIKKPGKNSNLAQSYRPISLLSVFGKITEYIILNRLNTFILNSDFINPNQYGFTKKLSTNHPLLRITEKVSSGFQRGRSTGAVFLDIQKAFDRVWISGLIYKLIKYNFPPSIIHILNSYLVNRQYQDSFFPFVPPFYIRKAKRELSHSLLFFRNSSVPAKAFFFIQLPLKPRRTSHDADATPIPPKPSNQNAKNNNSSGKSFQSGSPLEGTFIC